MANSKGELKRLEIPYFDGVNSSVSQNISKKQELSHCENARSRTIGSIEKRQGTRRLGNAISGTANYGLFFFENDTATNTGMFRVTTVSGDTNIYYLNTSANWTVLAGGGADIAAANVSTTIAEGCCFFVNGTDANKYIGSDGVTVTDSTSSTGHLYNSPIANVINYYKDRLYIGDYTVGSTRYKNGVMMSSMPVGIVSLVDGDHVAADCVADAWISVTDTKYIYATDTLDVYRGNTKVADITVKDKTETSIQINTITFAGSFTDFESADELWVDGTHTGTKVFRWAGNPESGVDVKEYDTLKLSGSQNDSITAMVNISNSQLILNKNNLNIWDGTRLTSADYGVGCVSKNGYVKALGTLFFIHYTGIFATSGGPPSLISAKVEEYINGATKAGLEAGAAGRQGKSVLFTIGDVTLYYPDGSVKKTLSDVCLEYNLKQKNWYIHTGITATRFATYISSSNPDRLEYASTDTDFHIFELFNGQTDNNVTASNEIPMEIETDEITLAKAFEKLSYPTEIIVETERGSGIQCFISLDGGQFYQIEGDIVKGCTILKVTNKIEGDPRPPSCRKMKISIRDYTKKLCKITRIAIIYAETQEEVPVKQESYGQ